MSLIYVHFEYREDSQTPEIVQIVNRYIDEKNLLTEKPRDVEAYQPLTKILVSVDSTVVDNFMEEISAIPMTAVKKHA